MFMSCKVHFYVERSASQINDHWVYVLLIRSPVDLMSCGIFVRGPLQLMFFCYTREKVPSSNSIVGRLTLACVQTPLPSVKIGEGASMTAPSIIEGGKILHKLKKID